MSEMFTRDVLVIRPGDHLVIRVDGDLDAADAERLKRDLLDRLPGLADVTVVGAQQILVYREGDGGG